MRKCLLILFFAFAAAGASAAQIDTVAVFSAKMQREIPALVVVPDAGVGRRMPVLYLLHGFGGSYTTWQNITDLRPLADACGMIVVCPDGANSWYWDSPLDPASQFETFVAQELPDWIDARYLTIPSREGRAVTGLSMGGHGALWVALRHKDRFGAAGSTSGGVDIRPFPDSWEMKKQLGELKDNPERWNAHTVIRQAASLRDGELALIFDCGYQDFFYQVNLNLHEQLMRQGVGHDFLVRPGAHNAAYWSASLPCQMLFFQRWFARNAPQPAVTASGRRVVYIGDSITDGNWGKADGKPSSQRNLWDRNHLFGSGYMYLCASYYQGYFPDRDYRFFNRGVGGHALGDLAARWQEDVIDLRPDVLSVFVGTNDAERHLGRLLRADDPKTVPDFDFADWERTYRGLLDQARQANPALKIVLCTPFAAPCGKIVEGALGEYYPLRQRILAQCCVIVERIAADYGATLVPFHRLIADLETRLPNGDATYWVWDGKDYSDQTMSDSERFKWIEFHKWQLKAQWFAPLTRNANLVLMARAEMGYLGSYNRHKVSPFERFEVGGDGMTGYNIYGIDVISMRGYDDGALDPVGENYAVAYNKYTLELRYPVILKPSSQIYVLGFLEGGNGFASWRQFSPFKIKRSAGFGVRLYLPIVGMLGIDWGYGFDPAAGHTKRNGSQFHFVMGQQF